MSFQAQPQVTKKETVCPHYGACGGCSMQDLSYEKQIEVKSQRIASVMAPFWPEPEGKSSGVDVPDMRVLPSPEIWYYRNKMEFGFGPRKGPDGKPEGMSLGFKRRGRWNWVLNVEDCRLLSPETPGLLDSVRSWASENGLIPYDSKRHAGFLRYLVVREGKNTGQRMVILITAPGDVPLRGTPRKGFLDAVLRSYPATTVLWGVNSKLSDAAQAEEMDILSGPGYIEEQIFVRPNRLRFKISPFSFFQTNSHGAQRVYSLIRDWVSGLKPLLALDLYGGCGGIALSLSDLVEKVVCVESSESAVSDAGTNRSLNGVSNVEFVCEKVEDFLAARSVEPSGLVILDPPRSGLHPKVVRSLLNYGPGRLIYVSCNYQALARDLASLTRGFRLERLEAVDMFPHTEHVEVLALLTSR